MSKEKNTTYNFRIQCKKKKPINLNLGNKWRSIKKQHFFNLLKVTSVYNYLYLNEMEQMYMSSNISEKVKYKVLPII